MGQEFLLHTWHCESIWRHNPSPVNQNEANYIAAQAGAPYGEYWAISEMTFDRDPFQPEEYNEQIVYPVNFEDRDSSWVFDYPPGGNWNYDIKGSENKWWWWQWQFTSEPVEEGWHILIGSVREYDYWKKAENFPFPPLLPGIGALPLPVLLAVMQMLMGGSGTTGGQRRKV